MADTRRHWKESIGVIPGRPKACVRPEKQREEPSSSPLREERPSRPESPPARLRQTESPNLGSVKQAQSAALELLEQMLDALPVGSLDFGRQAAARLWRDPAPTDLKRLAVIVKGLGRLERREKNVVLKAILLRQRSQRLRDDRSGSPLDPVALLALSSEWRRLASATSQAWQDLDPAGAEPAASEVLVAARELIPSADQLSREADLTKALSEILEAARNESFEGAALALPAIPEADELLARMKTGEGSEEEHTLLRLLTGIAIAQRDLSSGSSAKLGRDHLLLTGLSEELERALEYSMARHERNPELNALLATWRRKLVRVRSRVDEALTQPAAQHPEWTTQPVPAESGSPVSKGEEAIVEHLKSVRGEETTSEQGHGLLDFPGTWLAWTIAGVCLAMLLLIRAVLPSALPAPRPMTPDAFATAMPLTRVDVAGAFHVGTADPAWEELSSERRRQDAIRLMTAAELEGFRAGLIVGSDGSPLASWFPGQPPVLRRQRSMGIHRPSRFQPFVSPVTGVAR